MADLELNPAEEVPIEGLKRPREDGDALPETVEDVVSTPTPDDIAPSAKKLRSDGTDDGTIEQSTTIEDEAMVEAEEVAEIIEGVKEVAEVIEGVAEVIGEEVKEMAEVIEEEAKEVASVQEKAEVEGPETKDAAETKDDAEITDLAEQDGNGAADEENMDVDVKSGDQDGDGTKKQVAEVKLGPKLFTSSLDMFNYFYDLLRGWPVNFNVNKYEYMMLMDLIAKGHQDPQKKIGAGIEAFQVRVNPEFYSRCYYVIRKDGSAEDFSYRKCVDNLMPLPESLKCHSGDLNLGHKGEGWHKGRSDNKGRGGRFGGGGRGRGNRGRGRGRKNH